MQCWAPLPGRLPSLADGSLMPYEGLALSMTALLMDLCKQARCMTAGEWPPDNATLGWRISTVTVVNNGPELPHLYST